VEAFEIDFQNYRARGYEIRPETPFQIIWETTLEYGVDQYGLFTEQEIVEMNALMASSGRGEVEAHHSQRAEFFARALLAKLPEEDQAAVSEALVPIIKGDFELIRPTNQAMDMAVRLLVEHKQPLPTVVHRIARVMGGLGQNGRRIDNLSRWLMLEIKLRKMFEARSPAFTLPGLRRLWAGRADEAETTTNYQFRVDVHLVPDGKGHRRLALKPGDLAEALILHAARKIATGTKFQVCDQCKGPFLTGGAAGTKRKRSDARFCSDPCRWSFNNERRRK